MWSLKGSCDEKGVSATVGKLFNSVAARMMGIAFYCPLPLRKSFMNWLGWWSFEKCGGIEVEWTINQWLRSWYIAGGNYQRASMMFPFICWYVKRGTGFIEEAKLTKVNTRYILCSCMNCIQDIQAKERFEKAGCFCWKKKVSYMEYAMVCLLGRIVNMNCS